MGSYNEKQGTLVLLYILLFRLTLQIIHSYSLHFIKGRMKHRNIIGLRGNSTGMVFLQFMPIVIVEGAMEDVVNGVPLVSAVRYKEALKNGINLSGTRSENVLVEVVDEMMMRLDAFAC